MTNSLVRLRMGAAATAVPAVLLICGLGAPAHADDGNGLQDTMPDCQLQGGCPTDQQSATTDSTDSTAAAPAVTPAESGAVAWARDQLGQETYQDLCLRFVVDAYANGGGVDIGTAETAYDYWNAHADRQHHCDTNPPEGALVFWGPTDGYPEGHVALAEGGDTAISTSERTSTDIHELSITDRSATKPYLGWLMPD